MKIGIDVDGILADFCTPYQRLFVETTGRDTFQPGDAENPPDWNWPTTRGYTAQETMAVWERIQQDPDFWFNLEPLQQDFETLVAHYEALSENHEVSFITNRMGIQPRQQTQDWLEWLLMKAGAMTSVHVIIVGKGMKGFIAKAMELDTYIDDNYDNALDVITTSPHTRTYLMERSYNQGLAESRWKAGKAVKSQIDLLERRRVANLAEWLRAEQVIA